MRAVPSLALSCLTALLCVPAASWAADGDAPPRIVQQRLPDGSVVLTDRPQAGARTERSWSVSRDGAEDAAALQRREQAAREAAAVNERFSRQLERDREREHELALAQQRAAAADAERAAVRARREAEEEETSRRTIVLARPPRVHPLPPRPPEARPPRRPAPVVAPRSGATPSRPPLPNDRPGA